MTKKKTTTTKKATAKVVDTTPTTLAASAPTTPSEPEAPVGALDAEDLRILMTVRGQPTGVAAVNVIVASNMTREEGFRRFNRLTAEGYLRKQAGNHAILHFLTAEGALELGRREL